MTECILKIYEGCSIKTEQFWKKNLYFQTIHYLQLHLGGIHHQELHISPNASAIHQIMLKSVTHQTFESSFYACGE